MERWTDAKEDLDKLVQIDPENAGGKALLARVNAKIRQYEKSKNQMYKRMIEKSVD
jgi:Tfp pilus assembly protein PilF